MFNNPPTKDASIDTLYYMDNEGSLKKITVEILTLDGNNNNKINDNNNKSTTHNINELKLTYLDIYGIIDNPIPVSLIDPSTIDSSEPIHLSKLEHEESIFSTRKYIYLSYILSSWGNHMWDFASVVYVSEIFNLTLFYASLLGCLETLVIIVVGPKIGKFIDQNTRYNSVKISIVFQNLFISIASIFFLFAFNSDKDSSLLKVWYICILICACIIKVASTIARLSFSKDWVVAICSSNPIYLTTMNGSMRQIHLVCSILAPFGIGLLSYFIESKWAMLFIGFWSLVSYFIEFKLVKWVADQVPLLYDDKVININESNSDDARSTDFYGHILHYIASWRTYIAHPTFFASVAYSLLFLSLLNFHGPMTAYLKIGIGMDDLWLSICRGVAAAIGVFATTILPTLINRFGLLNAGLYSIWFQLLSLCLVLFSFVRPDSSSTTIEAPSYTSDSGLWILIMMLVGICLSRFGLWGFDMAQGQIMQEHVEQEHLGLINGTQESLCNIFELFSFSLSLIFSDPRTFFWPILISFLSVVLATLFYSIYYMKYKNSSLNDIREEAEK